MNKKLRAKRVNHTHDIELIRWPGRVLRVHIHDYATRTTFNDGHTHVVRGVTSQPLQGYERHTHYYNGVTTFEDGHVHRFRGWTGPPMFLPDGTHYHEFRGETSFDDGHTHRYTGRTGFPRPYR
jgi:hypothetical protein